MDRTDSGNEKAGQTGRKYGSGRYPIIRRRSESY